MTPDQIQKLLMPIAVIAFWLVLAYFVSKHARKRGRRQWLWFLLSALINPLLVWLIVAILPNNAGEQQAPWSHAGESERRQVDRADESVKCPNCGLINPASSRQCDCGYEFAAEAGKHTGGHSTALDEQLREIARLQEFSMVLLQSVEAGSFLYMRRKLAGISAFLIVAALGGIGGAPLSDALAIGLAAWLIVWIVWWRLSKTADKTLGRVVDKAARDLGFGEKFSKRAENEALFGLSKRPN